MLAESSQLLPWEPRGYKSARLFWLVKNPVRACTTAMPSSAARRSKPLLRVDSRGDSPVESKTGFSRRSPVLFRTGALIVSQRGHAQVIRAATAADEGARVGQRLLSCDRDRKWSMSVPYRLAVKGLRVVETPFQARTRTPTRNGSSDPSRRRPRPDVPVGERHLRRTIAEFVEHYHRERNHQGLENALIEGAPACDVGGSRRHQRLSGLLNCYDRAA